MGRIGTTTSTLLVGVVLAAGLQGCGDEGEPPRPAAASAAVPAPSPTGDPFEAVLDRLLPRLHPALDLARVGPGETFSDPANPEQTVGIELSGASASDGDVGEGQARLVVSGSGRSRSVVLPAGWTPAVLGRVFVLRGGGTAYVVSQEGGDSDTWSMYLDGRRRLVPVRVTGEVPFGSGYDEDGAHPFRTWAVGSGRFFTRVGIDDDRHRLYEWRVANPRSGTPTLAPEDLGVVCVDGRADTIARC